MALQKMIVCEKGENQADTALYPYQFYATENTWDTATDRIVINIVMPIGGAETGLYRFPKIGESVLVDEDDANNFYLLGYVPSVS
ncbi:MAG: hypothetical protein LBU28_00685, partial [Spirochaetaceae bacterium]|nr:hypothetical protein [Spirochaetaceae bacterium]